MIAQQRQQQVAAALETIVGSEEDRFKAAASKIEDSAHRAIDEQDRQLLLRCAGVRDVTGTARPDAARQRW